MTNIADLVERLRQNEEITRKFHEIERRILTVLDFKDLFEVLLEQIRDKFRVPYAWISMIESCDLSALVRSLQSSDILKGRLNLIDRESFLRLVGTGCRSVLANGDLAPFYRLLPNDHRYFIKSIAVVPLSLDGEVIGSLNQADFSPKRFQPGIDASSLEQLAVKVSICLSNVTAHERLRFLAYHDPLTGLLNRRVMESILNRELNRSKRYGSRLSVVFLDLDDFKRVNDRYGHDCGDELLRHVAGVLLEMSRDSDVVARFAGDEFVFILPETPSEKAEILMKRVQEHLDRCPLAIDGETIPASFSFGVASTEDSGLKSPLQILKRADETLYKAKELKRKEAMQGGPGGSGEGHAAKPAAVPPIPPARSGELILGWEGAAPAACLTRGQGEWMQFHRRKKSPE